MSSEESESDEEMAALFAAEKEGKPAVTVLSASVNHSQDSSTTNEVPHAAQDGGPEVDGEQMSAGEAAGSAAAAASDA